MKFEIGMGVIVRFARNDVFEFQKGAMELRCTLLWIPQGQGDHFHFQYGEIEFSLNPLCPDFVGILFIKE